MAAAETFVAPTNPASLSAQQVFNSAFVHGNGIVPQIYGATMSAGTGSIIRTLTAAQVVNAIVYVTKQAWTPGSYTITLPNPTTVPGARCRIEQGSIAAATSLLNVNCTGGALLMGNIILAGATAVGAATPLTTITFTATSMDGDYVELVSNGTYWCVWGNGSVVASFTFA